MIFDTATSPFPGGDHLPMIDDRIEELAGHLAAR